MSESTELLLLRLGLLALMLGFVWAVSLSLRRGLMPLPTRRTAPAPRRSGWRLTLEFPGDSNLPAGAEFGLAGRMNIGGSSEAGIMLSENSVSYEHAAIERVQGGWRLTDLRSTNGTAVNGREIPPNGVLLRGGEQLSFGAVVMRLMPPSDGPAV